MGVTLLDVIIDGGLALCVCGIDLWAGGADWAEKLARSPAVCRVVFSAALFSLIMALGQFYSGGQFIYFQF
jgi:hypothetical protein